MNDEQLRMYDLIINKPTSDWDIYYWMIGKHVSIIDSEITVMVFQIYQTIFRCFQPPILVGDLSCLPTCTTKANVLQYLTVYRNYCLHLYITCVKTS